MMMEYSRRICGNAIPRRRDNASPAYKSSLGSGQCLWEKALLGPRPHDLLPLSKMKVPAALKGPA